MPPGLDPKRSVGGMTCFLPVMAVRGPLLFPVIRLWHYTVSDAPGHPGDPLKVPDVSTPTCKDR